MVSEVGLHSVDILEKKKKNHYAIVQAWMGRFHDAEANNRSVRCLPLEKKRHTLGDNYLLLTREIHLAVQVLILYEAAGCPMFLEEGMHVDHLEDCKHCFLCDGCWNGQLPNHSL